MSRCPAETFPALTGLSFLRAAFIQRCPDVDVLTGRETARQQLWSAQRETADDLGFHGMPFATAEQVHGNIVAPVSAPASTPAPAADGLITSTSRLCLAISVADCAAVFLADKHARAIALVHSGKKGTELGIVPKTIAALQDRHDIPPEDLVVQIAPCIRPPHYEIDFAAEIIRQARAAGVRDVHDCGTCTASDPEKYYSYRREKGRTGRLLALLALV